MLTRKDEKIINDGLFHNNPVTFQVLGVCSILAVTVQVRTALVMSAALIFVLTMSNVIISLLRNLIPSKIRIIIQLLIVSTLVILADLILKAYLYDVSKQLSIFVGLIITNCIVMGRAEGFAMQNSPFKSFLDGISNGVGYSMILLVVASLRELLGSGTILGYAIIPEAFYSAGYLDCGLMMLAPGAFFLLGLIIWLQRAVMGVKEEG